jgi:hypothetical protein
MRRIALQANSLSSDHRIRRYPTVLGTHKAGTSTLPVGVVLATLTARAQRHPATQAPPGPARSAAPSQVTPLPTPPQPPPILPPLLSGMFLLNPAARYWTSCWRCRAVRPRCSWRCGPGTAGCFGSWERGIQTRCEDAPSFVLSTFTVGLILVVRRDRLPGRRVIGRPCQCKAQSDFPGSRKDFHAEYLHCGGYLFGILDL